MVNFARFLCIGRFEGNFVEFFFRGGGGERTGVVKFVI